MLTHTANIDRFIGVFLKNHHESSAEGEFSAESNEFYEFETIKTSSTAELKAFEVMLKDAVFQDRLIRYLKARFNFAGKGDTIFSATIRELCAPEVFLPYSWKGRKRGLSLNVSFKETHPTFTKFVTRVVQMGDKNKTAADVDSMFINLLRFKKQNHERSKRGPAGKGEGEEPTDTTEDTEEHTDATKDTEQHTDATKDTECVRTVEDVILGSANNQQ